ALTAARGRRMLEPVAAGQALGAPYPIAPRGPAAGRPRCSHNGLGRCVRQMNSCCVGRILACAVRLSGRWRSPAPAHGPRARWRSRARRLLAVMLVVGALGTLAALGSARAPAGSARAASSPPGLSQVGEAEGVARVVRDFAPVYSVPSTASYVVWRLYESSQVAVTGAALAAEDTLWRPVRLWNAEDGWLEADALSFAPYPPPAPPARAPAGATPTPAAPSGPRPPTRSARPRSAGHSTGRRRATRWPRARAPSPMRGRWAPMGARATTSSPTAPGAGRRRARWRCKRLIR